jgi:pimeloyl-ACP methyl ester carboxylesterase
MEYSKIGYLIIGIMGSALLIFGVVSGVRFRREITNARERLERLDSQVVQTECGPIEVAVRGEGQPVLVIHGNGGGFDQGLGLAEAYIDQGFQVIAPSRFGYLRSPVPLGADLAMQADAYACLLDSLGIGRVAIFTTSAGVTSTIRFALRHPERVSGLILHSPNAPGEVGLVAPPRAVFSALVHSDYGFWAMSTYMRPLMQSLVGVPKDFALTPEYQAQVQEILASSLPVDPRGDGIVFDTYVSNPEINHYPLEDVKTPTLVISAVDDPMALHSGARVLAERIPDARLVAVPDGGHIMLGHGDEVRQEVSQFLSGVFAAERQLN